MIGTWREASSIASTFSMKVSRDMGAGDLPLVSSIFASSPGALDPRLIGVLELLLALDFDSDLFSWR